jgi:hypothetical protein
MNTNLQFRQLAPDERPPDREYVSSVRRYGGTVAPFGYAGFVIGECAVVCHQCHDRDADSTESPIFGSEEVDYPGLICRDCGRLLDTRVLVYANGPGASKYEQLEDSDPDADADPTEEHSL